MRTLIGVAGFVWLRYLRYPWSRLHRSLFQRRYRSVPLPPAASLEDVRAALEQVTWTPDGPFHLYDSVSLPGRVWATRKDDCDGFSALAAALLEQLDATTSPVLVSTVVLPLKKAHTVCAFRAPGSDELRIFDNARLREDVFASYEEVARYVARRGEHSLYWDAVEPKTLRTLEFGRF